MYFPTKQEKIQEKLDLYKKLDDIDDILWQTSDIVSYPKFTTDLSRHDHVYEN